jgi:GDP-L-fucose synthase
MSEFWHEKRVLVTGGAGFLGKRVVHRLEELSAAEIVVPRSREYDLRNSHVIENLIEQAKPNIIFHLAAVVGGIGANRVNPGRYFYDNLIMGVQLMEISRQKNIDKFVAVGTICSYPKICPIPFKEESIWDGYPEETNAPYGLAKKMLIVQSDSYRTQYGFNSICLVPTNLYGPGDNFDPESSHVIPAIITKCLDAIEEGQEEIELWGTGKATREFLYVDDCSEGILLAAEHYNESEPVNLGSEWEISIRELAELIKELTGFKGGIKWNTSMPDGQPRRSVDSTRALKFGFQSKTNFKEGLKATIEWYREFQKV